MDCKHDAWIEIDLSAIRHNYLQVKNRVGDAVKVLCVVKADAYGHGALETARRLVEFGAYALGVTRLDEAARLRDGGVTAPILVFDSIQPDMASEAVRLGVNLTVCTKELAFSIGEAAREARKTVDVHIKIDTGMGRLGALPKDAVSLADSIASTEGLRLAGTYTHFSTAAEKDISRARTQLERFNRIVAAIRDESIDPGLVHAANSAAILRLPDSHFDMVRTGTMLYGQYPSRFVPQTLELVDTWKLKARISFVKTVPAGYPIGYGAEYIAKRRSRIAVFPLGWADGLALSPESVFRRNALKLMVSKMRNMPVLQVIVRGHRVPVVGRIAMQMCSIDVTDFPEIEVGDEVVVPARRVTASPLLPKVYVERSTE